MPYYAQGDYYSGRGDYYSGRGDFWKKAKKAVGKIGKIMPVAAAMVPTKSGIANALGTLSQGMGAMPGAGFVAGGAPSLAGILDIATKGLTAYSAAKSAGGGGATYVPAAEDNPFIPNVIEGLWDGKQRKRRTMNAANVNALRRALRRVDSFRTLAKKSGALPAAKRLPPQRSSSCCK